MPRLLQELLVCTVLALAFPPGAAVAQEQAKPGSVAYPDNPSATPQAQNKGAPVVTDKAACASATRCPDKPAASVAADTGSTGEKVEPGVVKTPSTAYPDSPVKTPAAEPTGTAPKQ